MSRLRTLIPLVAILVAILAIDVLSARHDSLTYDEPTHFRYGSNILKLDSSRFVDGTMPWSALNALPQRIAPVLPAGAVRKALDRVETGRLATILFSLVLGFYVYKWARELYGAAAGFFSLFLYALSPNIIAHSRLITTDVYAAGMVTISTYYFWKFANRGGWKLGIASAILAGVSQLAKYSCIFIYPIFVLILIVRHWGSLVRRARARDLAGAGRPLGAFAKYAVIFAVVGALVINAGFLFNRSMVPFGKYEFRSEAMKGLQARLGVLKHVPVPLAYPYLDGLDWGKMREETGRGFGSMYLLGELREIGGFKDYYLVAFLFKEPIAFQVLIVLAAVLYVLRRRRYAFMRNEVFLVVPVASFALYFNLVFKLQIGIRHFLVAVPFMQVFAGSLVSEWPAIGRKMKAALALLSIYLAASVFSYFPYYIPYFNELVWDRKQAYRILADSNLDWGQASGEARRYKAEHPEVYLEEGMWHMKTYRERHREEYERPQFPDSGQIVVNVNNYVGIYHPFRYQWLRDKYKPVGHIAYAYLIFDLSPESPTGTPK
jgi:4-amino-4-deoxy-L-arabinose transferase-like glycosyltransferase